MFPTIQEVESANIIQLARWYRFLPSAMTPDETKVQDLIYDRFHELGGMTPEISKVIGFK